MATPLTTTLHGSCYCKRNTYTITPGPFEFAPGDPYKDFGPPPYVYYDHCSDCRKLQSSLLLGWIRAPRSWYTHTTHPRSTSETDQEIFKLLVSSSSSPSSPSSSDITGPTRNFCGFCGTHLLFLGSSCRRDGWVEIPLGSLDDGSLEMLEGMGLKPDFHTWWRSAIGWVKRDLVEGRAKGEGKCWRGEVEEGVEGEGLEAVPEGFRE
ncbi:hypothetical protein EX30DRAFT_395664 [Ascodesmis nigricans]|uniref:CENP-V/GFA domain-containing protein n=1 Tax=Ascodesmis nigricans TaxID=341454 RepID=A0A4S2MXX2_9PEZI|nr:hypothetical protein EX30DRAFT_395664 [Ascodesmis nigricans]